MFYEELIALIQSGHIELIAHYSPLEGRAQLLRYYHRPISTETDAGILACIAEHQAQLYYLAKGHHSLLCSDKATHQPWYVPDLLFDQLPYLRCKACELRRKGMVPDEETLYAQEKIDLQTR